MMPTLRAPKLDLPQGPEAGVEVRDAGIKGKGVFAVGSTIPAETWVCQYMGELLMKVDVEQRYPVGEQGDYLFKLTEDLCIDAEHSTHVSRFFNHAQFGNMRVNVDESAQRIDFYTTRAVAPDEELTFDYGPTYWRFRPQPSAESDSRNFNGPMWNEREPELTLRFPPRPGTVLPLIPMDAVELQAALMLPNAECRAALLRCLEFFGSNRTADGGLAVRLGVEADAPCEVLGGAELEGGSAEGLATLQRAAVACVVQGVLDPADGSGEASREFERWVSSMDAEMSLIRRWRERVPRFASARHDAASIAAYLLWKCPDRHAVSSPLGKDDCNELIAALDACGPRAEASADREVARADREAAEVEDEGLQRVLVRLSEHAEETYVSELVGRIQRWCEIGEGCTVVRDPKSRREGGGGVPTLVGAAIPQHLDVVWRRLPKLVEYGLY